MKRFSQWLIFAGLLLLTTGFVAQPLAAEESLWNTQIHGHIMLDAKVYPGDEATTPSGSAADDQFSLRKGAVSLAGVFDEWIEYDLELGASTCASGGNGVNVKVLDAGIMMRLTPQIKLGVKKGHVMRGFELRQECVERMTAEKPMFSSAYAPCHPTGVFLETAFPVQDYEIKTEFAYLNNNDGGATAEDEYDLNLGAIVYTPVPGLALSGYYNATRKDFAAREANGAYTYTRDNGFRSGFGVDFQCYGLWLRSEFFMGEGFSYKIDDIAKAIDVESQAYYAQMAYEIPISYSLSKIQFVQPYVQFQSWDKAKNSDEDYEYQYFVAGMTLGLKGNARLRFDWQQPLSNPDIMPNVDGQQDEAQTLIVRLQTSF